MTEKKYTHKIFNMICIGLLIFHIIYVCIHMYWHYHDKVNPWKLAGYAMYTRPDILITAQISHSINGELNHLWYNHHIRRYGWAGCIAGFSEKFYPHFIAKNKEMIDTHNSLHIHLWVNQQDMKTKDMIQTVIGYATITKIHEEYNIHEIYCEKAKNFVIRNNEQ